MKTAAQIQHTPGPWAVHFCHRQPNLPSGEPYWFYVIERAEDEAHEANARLIAAAPELLAAAKRFTALFVNPRGGCWDQVAIRENSDIHHHLRTAIYKAEA